MRIVLWGWVICTLRVSSQAVQKKKKEVTQLVEPAILGWTEEGKILTVCFCFLPLTLLTYLPVSICRLPGLAAGTLNEPLPLSPLWEPGCGWGWDAWSILPPGGCRELPLCIVGLFHIVMWKTHSAAFSDGLFTLRFRGKGSSEVLGKAQRAARVIGTHVFK